MREWQPPRGLPKLASARKRPMFRFRRDRAIDVAPKHRSKDSSTPAEKDAKLPERPSSEGYKIDVLSFDSVVHLFKRPEKRRE
jgi:hypothetical protein